MFGRTPPVFGGGDGGRKTPILRIIYANAKIEYSAIGVLVSLLRPQVE
jgi:hypothetical protein